MQSNDSGPDVSFSVFFAIWAEIQGWIVPDFHYYVCDWLDNRGDLALLMMPRGHAKSTILDVLNAYLIYKRPSTQILHQGSTDPDAYKVSRGTEEVLRRHPLTQSNKKIRGEVQRWWVDGSEDVRYGTMYCRGIMSIVTGHRADEIQNDDVEVPQNIETPEAREKLRRRLSEQVHIKIPGGRELYVGTPHTFESLYKEIEDGGADCLILPAFGKEERIDSDDDREYYRLDFDPEYIFMGIGAHTKVLNPIDYSYSDGILTIHCVKKGVIDCYANALWPERFTPQEMAKRRKKCKTLNEWDSQYMLRAKPIGNVRLDPDKAIVYDIDPVFSLRNGINIMTLGNALITSMRAYWDVAAGKKKGDKSVLSIVLGDDAGNYYWQEAHSLEGDNDGDLNVQIDAIEVLVKKYQIPSIYVETNGIGQFVPAALRKRVRLHGCTVVGEPAKGNKNERIAAGIEPPLISGALWVHSRLFENGAMSQMREWNPKVENQPDDFIDSGASAILKNPVRIGRGGKSFSGQQPWRPTSQTIEAKRSTRRR